MYLPVFDFLLLYVNYSGLTRRAKVSESKDEGGRRKDEVKQKAVKTKAFRFWLPSAFCLLPSVLSSLIPHPSSLLLHPAAERFFNDRSCGKHGFFRKRPADNLNADGQSFARAPGGD
ncbi:MAG: hypothetical protein QOC96_1055 [Acidobacteriota bacterium]|nr:hypothetical protein [Acidobacteriota bacterium]